MTGRPVPLARCVATLAALAVLAAVVSCDDASESSGGRPGAPTTTGPPAMISLPGVSTTFVAPTTTVASRFEFVDYTVSGGVAGVSDLLKVYPDGRVAYNDGQRSLSSTISAATVAELRAALEAADLASLPSVSGSPTPDALVYRVIFGGQAVRFYDGSMPPSLSRAITILTRELNRVKQQR